MEKQAAQDLFNTRPVMKCGCVAMFTYSFKGEHGVSCIVHDCKEVADKAPDLSGRKARCSYYGRPVKTGMYNSNCCNTCKAGEVCACEQDSSPSLWFFKFKGEGSETATEVCGKCKKNRKLHYPLWELTVKQKRRWYKIDESVTTDSYKEYCPDRESAEVWAKKEADRRLHWSDFSNATKVKSVEIISLVEIPNPNPCRDFVAQGALPYDEFYCACHGAD